MGTSHSLGVSKLLQDWMHIKVFRHPKHLPALRISAEDPCIIRNMAWLQTDDNESNSHDFCAHLKSWDPLSEIVLLPCIAHD